MNRIRMATGALFAGATSVVLSLGLATAAGAEPGAATPAASSAQVCEPPGAQAEAFTPIEQRYWNEPELRALLGCPVDTEYTDGDISYQYFEFGNLYHSPETGVHEVHGDILATYLELGQYNHWLGLPTTDEYTFEGFQRSEFQGGYMLWNPETREVTVHAVA